VFKQKVKNFHSIVRELLTLLQQPYSEAWVANCGEWLYSQLGFSSPFYHQTTEEELLDHINIGVTVPKQFYSLQKKLEKAFDLLPKKELAFLAWVFDPLKYLEIRPTSQRVLNVHKLLTINKIYQSAILLSSSLTLTPFIKTLCLYTLQSKLSLFVPRDNKSFDFAITKIKKPTRYDYEVDENMVVGWFANYTTIFVQGYPIPIGATGMNGDDCNREIADTLRDWKREGFPITKKMIPYLQVIDHLRIYDDKVDESLQQWLKGHEDTLYSYCFVPGWEMEKWTV